jgi:hypothetical protein
MADMGAGSAFDDTWLHHGRLDGQVLFASFFQNFGLVYDDMTWRCVVEMPLLEQYTICFFFA